MTDSTENKTRLEGGQAWPRERVLALVLAGVTALALYVCYRLASPLLPALAWALALAIVAHPLHAWVARRVRNANVSAGLSVFIVAVVIIAPVVFVTRQLAREAVAGVEAVRGEAAAGRWRAAAERWPGLAPALSWLEEQVDMRAAAENLSATLGSRVSSFIGGSVWAAAELLITLFALFYFLRDRRAAVRKVRSLVPLSDAETDEVFGRVTDTVYATVYGTLVVGLVQGLLGGLMFWWLGLPAPLLWGVVMALLAVVPVLGAFVVWLPAAVFLALEGSWAKALILTGWGTIIVGLIDNLLYPALVGKRLRLHTLPVFVAIVGGIMLFGAAGLILGPVALAVTAALVDVWRRRTAGGGAAEVGVKEASVNG